ncbi:MAG: hypothetical protein K2I00_01240 [Ruminococcus sp.]|nr:hypothetical protein [Ruminococcus sp.]
MKDKCSILTEKYLKNGFDSLSDMEKLMLVLSYSEEKKSVQKIAENIYKTYGTFNVAVDCDSDYIMRECGINEQSAVLLKIISQISRRNDIYSVSKLRLNTSENAKKYFSAYMKGMKTEVFVATAVNKQFYLIKSTVLASGGFRDVVIVIRSIVEFALKNDASYIFISHCHPNESSAPSVADISATRRIKESLKNADVFLADHIITGADGAVSLREVDRNDLFDKTASYISDDA